MNSMLKSKKYLRDRLTHLIQHTKDRKSSKGLYNNEGFTLVQLVIVIIITAALVIISARGGLFDAFGGLNHLTAVQDIAELQSLVKLETNTSVSNAVDVNDNGFIYTVSAPPSGYLTEPLTKKVSEDLTLTYSKNTITAPTSAGRTLTYAHSDNKEFKDAPVTVSGMSGNTNSLPAIISAANTQIEKDLFMSVMGLEQSQAYINAATADKVLMYKKINTVVFGSTTAYDDTGEPDRLVYLVQVDQNYIKKNMGSRATFDPKKYKVFYVEGVTSREYGISILTDATKGGMTASEGAEAYNFINATFAPKDIIIIPHHDKDIIYDTNKVPLYKISNN